MGWRKPEPAVVWRAIDAFLQVAYDGPPGPGNMPANTPSAVRARLESLRMAPEEDFYASPVFETNAAERPTKFSLRLGNRFYPHMKVVLERAPDGHACLIRADTHDAHCRPAPGSRDYAAFTALMERNREIAERAEAAWEASGLMTFKAFLRRDLAARKAK